MPNSLGIGITFETKSDGMYKQGKLRNFSHINMDTKIFYTKY